MHCLNTITRLSDEKQEAYTTHPSIIQQALDQIRSEYSRPEWYLTQPQHAKEYLQILLAREANERFTVLFLDNRHGVIADEVLFQGTVDGASVHPRVVAQKALEYNASAVVFAHNYPSGDATPSRADQLITDRLMETLKLIDVRVLDHLVIGPRNVSTCFG